MNKPGRASASRDALLVVGGISLTLTVLGACAGPQAGAEQGTTATAVPEEAIVARGAQLYATNCQACHGDKNGVARLPHAPSHGNDGHTWHHSDRNLIEIIMNGGDEMTVMMRSMSGVPEDAPRMPAWKDKLTEEEVRAILIYLKTFWSPERRRMQEQSPMMP